MLKMPPDTLDDPGDAAKNGDAMQQVGRTSTGNIIVEMSAWEWEQVQLRPLNSENTDTLLWQIRHARHQGKLDDPLTRLLSRACTPGGRLADVTFADFLAMIESGEITQVPQVGPARARTLYEVFVSQRQSAPESVER